MYQLPSLEQVILCSKAEYIERFSPCICPCPLLPCPSCCQPCEQPNEYTIMNCDEQWENRGQNIYTLKESSSFSQRYEVTFSIRCLCPPSRRSFELFGQNIFDEIHIKATKPLKCPFFCLSRPEMQVNYREQYIGKVRENLQWGPLVCQFHKVEPVLMKIGKVCCYDKNNALLFEIEATLCQCGLFCLSPCSACREIRYVVRNREGMTVGVISHIFGGFKREYCSKADGYGIKFPENSTVEEKILLILATTFIDYQQFENY